LITTSSVAPPERDLRARALASFFAVPLLLGCGGAQFHPSAPANAAGTSSALGPSYTLLPRSRDDDTLLGRVLLDVPDNGRSLDELSRPNECADKLEARKEDPVVVTFEDAVELSPGGKAGAALRTFGFEEDGQAATHFYYKIDLEKRLTQTVTPDYLACCKDKGTCGYGVISALGYGQAQYATAVESRADGSVDIPVAGGERGMIKARLLHKRFAYGYIAALVTVTDGAGAKTINVLGDTTAAAVEPREQDLPEQARRQLEAQKIQVVSNGGSPAEYAYSFRDGNGEISENEFIRRYEAVTGSMNLSGAKRNHSSGWLSYGIAASAVGAVLIGAGAYIGLAKPASTEIFSTPPTPGELSNCNSSSLQLVSGIGYEVTCNQPINPGLGEGLAIMGGAVAGSGLVSLVIYGIRGYDGPKADHVISKSNADLYVALYNRALLRMRLRATPPVPPQPSGRNEAPPLRLLPVVSPGFTGLAGQF